MAVQTRMTAQEFWELPETNQFIELIDGEVMMSPTPVPMHQLIIVKLVVLLDRMASKYGGNVIVAPLSVHLDEENALEPDAMWIAPDSKCTIGDKYVIGGPDLVIEVFSPSTALRDKTVKFRLYEKYGVRVYWMIDPIAKYVEVWQAEDQKFVQQGIYGPDDKFSTVVFPDDSVEVNVILGV